MVLASLKHGRYLLGSVMRENPPFEPLNISCTAKSFLRTAKRILRNVKKHLEGFQNKTGKGQFLAFRSFSGILPGLHPNGKVWQLGQDSRNQGVHLLHGDRRDNLDSSRRGFEGTDGSGGRRIEPDLSQLCVHRPPSHTTLLTASPNRGLDKRSKTPSIPSDRGKPSKDGQ